MVDEIVRVIGADQAKVNITWKGENGDLPDSVLFDSGDADVLQWITEAVRTGGVPGIKVDATADFHGYVVDRYKATDDVTYNRIMCRPKTEFGQ